MQGRRRSWSVVRVWTSRRFQVSLHVPSVALAWAATASSATAASTGCTRNTVDLSAWTLNTDVHGDRGLHAPWTADQRGPIWTWQAGGSGFLLLPRRCSQQLAAVNFQLQHVWKPPERSSRSCYQFSLPATSLSRHVAASKAHVSGVKCSMPVSLGHWQSQTSNVFSEMTGQWSDRSAMSSRKTLSPTDPVSYLRGLALRIWTTFWRREGFAVMDMWNAPMVQSKKPLTYRLMESEGLGGQRCHGSSWQRGIAESKLSAIDPHDRHTCRSGVRSAIRTVSQPPVRGSADVYPQTHSRCLISLLFSAWRDSAAFLAIRNASS